MIEMENITNEMLLRIFGAYWGSEVRAIFHEKPIIFIPDGFEKDETGEWLKQDGSIIPLEICKLILTTLDKISDEDAVGVCTILNLQFSNTDDSYFFDLAGVAEYLKEMFEDENRFGDAYSFAKTLQAIDFLRSKGYDTGYAHIKSLVAANVAVDKTTL